MEARGHPDPAMHVDPEQVCQVWHVVYGGVVGSGGAQCTAGSSHVTSAQLLSFPSLSFLFCRMTSIIPHFTAVGASQRVNKAEEV